MKTGSQLLLIAWTTEVEDYSLQWGKPVQLLVLLRTSMKRSFWNGHPVGGIPLRHSFATFFYQYTQYLLSNIWDHKTPPTNITTTMHPQTTIAPTHARRSLPVNPNPILTPPNLYGMGLHDAAAHHQKFSKIMFPLINLSYNKESL